MSKKTKLSDAELDAFTKAMAGVTPLNHKEKVRLTRETPKLSVDLTDFTEDHISLSETSTLPPVTSETQLVYKQTGISNKILRKLRKGQYNVEAILDLHGMSVEEAKQTIESFLSSCLNENFRVVLIIHGKGRHQHTPILKNKLNQWLRHIDPVLAFCSASPYQGSSGAIYVLLKRTREETEVD